jgi:hypothetical protein
MASQRGLRLGLPLTLLALAAGPVGCSQSSPNVDAGSGGSSQSTGGASGGNGGGSTAKGGSGGSATGGASGGSSAGSGGSGDGGSGAGNGGAVGGAGGTSPGGAGGSNPGGPDGGNDDAEPAATCTDKLTNGNETDSDCGGATCPKCGAGKLCKADSDCKSGSCSSGKCADPFAPTGTVTSNGNLWKITAGAMTLEVQTGGAKVVTYSLDGTNSLVINSGSTGSVFWIAPQSEWSASGWPPPSEMDENTTFTAMSKDGVLAMTGPTGTDGLSITKRFWANTEHQTVTLEYTFKNGSTAEIKKAPWEISRVYPGGLTFFPYGETPEKLAGTCNCFLEVPFTTTDGIAWFKYQKSTFTQDIKGGADGLEGWAAHINCGAGLEQACTSTFGTKSMVLIKEWDDSTTQAPGEKEVEIYANAGHNYVEFEQQGNYQAVPAGATVVWTMHWMLRYLPTTIAPTAGSAELVKWVRSQLLL